MRVSDDSTNEMQICVYSMLFRQLGEEGSILIGSILYEEYRTYRSYFHLVSLEIILRESGKQENDLSLDNGVYICCRRVVHVGRPGGGHRAPGSASRTCRRFE